MKNIVSAGLSMAGLGLSLANHALPVFNKTGPGCKRWPSHYGKPLANLSRSHPDYGMSPKEHAAAKRDREQSQ